MLIFVALSCHFVVILFYLLIFMDEVIFFITQELALSSGVIFRDVGHPVDPSTKMCPRKVYPEVYQKVYPKYTPNVPGRAKGT